MTRHVCASDGPLFNFPIKPLDISLGYICIRVAIKVLLSVLRLRRSAEGCPSTLEQSGGSDPDSDTPDNEEERT